MKIRHRLRRAAAFTLLEIMLVVAIISLLLGSAFYFMGGQLGIGQAARIGADFTAINSALQTYRMVADDQMPTTEQGLQALVTMPQSEPKPSKWYPTLGKVPRDPWNREYVYVYPGKHNTNGYDLSSKGKDGVDGTEDDTNNWSNK